MRVNGAIIALDKSHTLYDFLKSQGYDISTIAIELNGEIIPKADYEDVILSDEAAMEIVRFVGGG